MSLPKLMGVKLLAEWKGHRFWNQIDVGSDSPTDCFRLSEPISQLEAGDGKATAVC